jgi:hypothetical protein
MPYHSHGISQMDYNENAWSKVVYFPKEYILSISLKISRINGNSNNLQQTEEGHHKSPLGLAGEIAP